MKPETLKRKAPKFKEEIITETLSDAELFSRRKMAEFIVWERNVHDYLVEYGMWPKVKITAELVFGDEDERSDSKTT